jgi:hypothetical protein
MRTELKQLTDYQTFIVLDSGEDIPNGYQKILHQIGFDVRYDLRHKARLVAGGNWTVNDKETFTLVWFVWILLELDFS